MAAEARGACVRGYLLYMGSTGAIYRSKEALLSGSLDALGVPITAWASIENLSVLQEASGQEVVVCGTYLQDRSPFMLGGFGGFESVERFELEGRTLFPAD